MYGNMTREEMIQRLYEGNFTTGELERQLIAKLFEQCCGGEGGSSGGGAFKVECNIDENRNALVLNKTAGEIMDAHETSTVFVSFPDDGAHQTDTVITNFSTLTISDSANIPKYQFFVNGTTFVCSSLDDFPYFQYNDDSENPSN